MNISVWQCLLVVWMCMCPISWCLISRGTPCQDGEYPFMAALLYDGSQICGGSLIRDNMVLTAAHCVSRKVASELSVYLGHVTLTSWSRGALNHSFVFPVKQIIVPSGMQDYPFRVRFNPLVFAKDIALLVLSRKVDLAKRHSERVNLIPLPDSPSTRLITSQCVAIGWGRREGNLPTVVLRKVGMSLASDFRCRLRFPVFDSQRQCCAVGVSVGGGTCTGDSGGPLICPLVTNPNKHVLVGITSFGSFCGLWGSPSYFTKVAGHLDWIQHSIASPPTFSTANPSREVVDFPTIDTLIQILYRLFHWITHSS